MVRSARRARLEPWASSFETAAFVGLLRMRELVYGRRMRIFPIALLTALLAPAPAPAQTDDLLGKYASAKIYCIDDEKLSTVAIDSINGYRQFRLNTTRCESDLGSARVDGADCRRVDRLLLAQSR